MIFPPSHEVILKQEVILSKNNWQPGSSNFLKEYDRPLDRAKKQITDVYFCSKNMISAHEFYCITGKKAEFLFPGANKNCQ